MSGKEFRYAAYCWSKITVGHQGFLQVNKITIVLLSLNIVCSVVYKIISSQNLLAQMKVVKKQLKVLSIFHRRVSHRHSRLRVARLFLRMNIKTKN